MVYVSHSMVIVQAPAKINLWLRIFGKRADGFHEVETLMLPLALADEVRIAKKEGAGIDFVCDSRGIETGADVDNLAFRAAQSYFAALQCLDKTRFGGFDALGVRIELQKNIPSGAGLAGGSSDAAAVLRGLQQLLDAPLSPLALQEIAASLGSDIPFFLQEGAAICRGRGEEIQPVTSPWTGWVLLVKPPFGVSTAWAYREYSRSAVLLSGEAKEKGGRLWQNDLEAPVFSKFLLLPTIKEWLAAQPGVDAAMMSGSGATVFAVSAERHFLEDLLPAFCQEFGVNEAQGEETAGASAPEYWIKITRSVC